MMQELVTENKRKEGKIRLGEAPYTYARVAVMRSKLIRKDDYYRLLKMKLNDIIRFLQETEYKKEIDEMAVSYSGVELVELALNKNIVKTFNKLKRIAEYDGLRRVMEEYMKRNDIWNLKTIIRGRFTGQSEERIKDLLIPVGELSESFLLDLLKKESIEDIIKAIDLPDQELVNQAIELFREKNSLFALENLLDRAYYEGAIEFSRKMPRQGHVFRKFIENEIDTLNIKILLRMKKAGIEREEAERFLIPSGADLSVADLRKLAGAEDTDSLMGMLEKMGYAKITAAYDRSKKDIAPVELKLSKQLLDDVILLLHTYPLSVDVILGYMFAKEIEARNIRMLIKGKQLGLQDEFIENELVIGG